MSLNKKKNRGKLSPKYPGKILWTNDYTGRQGQGKIMMTRGFNIETPIMSEIVPYYAKCGTCKKFLGKKEENLADVLDNNCTECFEIQIEEEFAANVLPSPITVVSKIERRNS